MDQNTSIEQAAAHFRALLTEQLNRQERMAQGSPAKDFSRMERIVIGLIPGDGIGPILMAQARRVLEKLLAAELAVGRVELRDIEGLTIENRTAQGKAIPDEVLAAIKDCDVLLKGPTETPKGGTLESANVAMRRELDLFANVRPVSVPKLGIDWTFFRENTEGEYALGSRGVEVPGMLSMDFKVTTDAGTRRIAKAAFDFARANGKTNVAIVTKANIMKKTDGMFTRICHEVAADYPEITAEDWYIDIMTANLVNPEIRSRFQVFVLPNLYGDIVTDYGYATNYSDGGNIQQRPSFTYVARYPGSARQGERQKPEQRQHHFAKNLSGRSCNDGRRKFAVVPCVPPYPHSACGRNRPIPGDSGQRGRPSVTCRKASCDVLE